MVGVVITGMAGTLGLFHVAANWIRPDHLNSEHDRHTGWHLARQQRRALGGLAGASEDDVTRSTVAVAGASSAVPGSSAQLAGSSRYDTDSSVVPVSL
jgi:hypothetical protein